MGEVVDGIITTFKNIITIYEETASLLEDAGAMLEASGYRCLHQTTVGTEQSKQMAYPGWWITPFAARYFVVDENPTEVKAVGVFFVDKGYTPIEPIIAAACFRMKTNEAGDVLPYWHSYLKEAWFTALPERKLGEVLEFLGKWNFEGGKIRAVPLEDVKDQETLKKSVVDPLIDMSC